MSVPRNMLCLQHFKWVCLGWIVWSYRSVITLRFLTENPAGKSGKMLVISADPPTCSHSPFSCIATHESPSESVQIMTYFLGDQQLCGYEYYTVLFILLTRWKGLKAHSAFGESNLKTKRSTIKTHETILLSLETDSDCCGHFRKKTLL